MGTSSQKLAIQVEGLHKAFNGKPVLTGVELGVPRGSIFTVLGPSGAGKSVFLKCLANIIPPDAGRILFDGSELAFGDRNSQLEFRRRCSFLFQSNALFDSLTSLENVALPLEQTTSLANKEIRKRSLEALNQLEIEEYAGHYPAQLSGGMQKRL
ncbi:ATP-binding cassette domain-containing protein, partial [bacterium]|nr:ATP-binding cassette domain-containing protein [bacterium]NBS51404.1 ATP-binding cassette domain-containing protein [Spartobacteria bacterium]